MQPSRSKLYGGRDHARKVYLIAPKHPENFWSMQGTVDLFGAKTLMPNNALATLMALTPPEICVEYILCDENVSTLDFTTPCDLAAVTGGTLHAPRIREICRKFKERGVPVALGGTYASILPEECEGLADFLFVGEAEYTWPQFLQEWVRGKASPEYRQAKYIDMKDSPAPDWSLIDSGDYLNISVQTGRGCPNRCDFCDVVQYVGRGCRTKPIDAVMEEVRRAHRIGAKSVFFSDDNFYGKPAYTNELLERLIEWNGKQAHPLSFSTQITVQVADDDALLKKFADARFSVLFLGVETVRKDSLDEVHKGQNANKDIRQRIRAISKYGIVPFIGLIVGFDHDDESVFDELYSFLSETDSPIAGISLLNAPKKTPLHQRLKEAGRLVEDNFSGEWQLETNIVPLQMTRDVLVQKYWNLFCKLYEPQDFGPRLMNWLMQVDYFTDKYPVKKVDWSQFARIGPLFGHFLFNRNPNVRRMFLRVMRLAVMDNPKLIKRCFTLLAQYRHFHDFVSQRQAGNG